MEYGFGKGVWKIVYPDSVWIHGVGRIWREAFAEGEMHRSFHCAWWRNQFQVEPVPVVNSASSANHQDGFYCPSWRAITAFLGKPGRWLGFEVLGW